MILLILFAVKTSLIARTHTLLATLKNISEFLRLICDRNILNSENSHLNRVPEISGILLLICTTQQAHNIIKSATSINKNCLLDLYHQGDSLSASNFFIFVMLYKRSQSRDQSVDDFDLYRHQLFVEAKL